MKSFFEPSEPLVTPLDIVSAFTKKSPEALKLPSRAVIVFHIADLQRILREKAHYQIESWLPYRSIYRVDGSDTVITRCLYGGPNIASLVEELTCFGVTEYILWGYCGALNENLRIGDILIGEEALREDGVSYHYLDSPDDFVKTEWFESWKHYAGNKHCHRGRIWSCDAIYRETQEKVKEYRARGIDAVEMEVASFYAVCLSKKVRCIAFLVVSDQFLQNRWVSGFHRKALREGVKNLSGMILADIIL